MLSLVEIVLSSRFIALADFGKTYQADIVYLALGELPEFSKNFSTQNKVFLRELEMRFFI